MNMRIIKRVFLCAFLAGALHSEYVLANSDTTESTPPEVALKLLKEGNLRFVAHKSLDTHESMERVWEVSKGQHPFAIILSCADSRVPPELIFDQGIGDLFVVREAGNNGGQFAIASIEYAVEHLGAKLIVVLGHTSCGAVKAALSTPKGSSAGSPALDALVSHLQIGLKGHAIEASDPGLFAPVSANVSAAASDLLKSSPILEEHVAKGTVKIAQAVYDLKSGRVSFLSEGFSSPRSESPADHLHEAGLRAAH